MRIAVTGANGFIGRHVIAELAHYPVDIVPVVRSLPALNAPYPASGISAPPHISGAPYVSNSSQSILSEAIALDLAAPPQDPFEYLGRPEVVLHLAWGGLPNYRSLHHFEEELPQHYRFLRALIQAGLPSLLVAGSCFEYGLQSGALHEQLCPAPNNSYGFAKNALRCQLQFMQQQHAYQLTWARIFYLHGDGQSKHSLLPKLQAAVNRGDAVFKVSGGEQLRDYLPIRTAAQYMVRLALGQANPGIINICSGTPISIRSLLEQTIAAHQWNIALNFGYYPYAEDESMAFWGDRSKLDRYLAS